MPHKSIDTHGTAPPAQYFEPDPATVEACAKVAERRAEEYRTMEHNGVVLEQTHQERCEDYAYACDTIASAIRSLAGREQPFDVMATFDPDFADTFERGYPRNNCGRDGCADLGCYGYCQPSPSQPVAGLTEAMVETAARAVRQARVKSITPPDMGTDYDRSIAIAVINSLTSSPVSEEELAKAIASAMDKFYVPPIHLHAARALLSQFSIGRRR